MFDFPVAYLNSNDGTSILAFGDGETLEETEGTDLSSIQSFIEKNSGQYIFTCLSFDLKNRLEKLTSVNLDSLNFPDAILWVPKQVVLIDGEYLNYVQGEKTQETEQFITEFLKKEEIEDYPALNIDFQPRTSKADYINHVEKLKEEIQLGNIYEINYCQEFFAENEQLEDASLAYFKLNSLTKAPYSSLFSIGNHTVLSGSPELYISKEGNKLSSSPIKGTRKRGQTPEEDRILLEDLQNDQKEISENVMIVDLVRNDLSKIAEKGSVQVDELFGAYSFETVHQLISTISCTVNDQVTFQEILEASFPMGSMTGAPKISALSLIEEHEDFKRGIYSGSIGFIAPNGDFTLNVVIRTIVFNHLTNYVSCAVGGAITINSDPEKEYEECLVKVKGILDQMNA